MNNIETFVDILSSIQNFQLWTYDKDGQLISSGVSDDRHFMIDLFGQSSDLIKEAAYAHARPSIIGSEFGTSWIVDSLRKNDLPETIYALGPFYIDSFPENDVKDKVYALSLPLSAKQKLFVSLSLLPVVSFMKVVDYTIMMHYAITSEQISTYDLHVEEIKTPDNFETDDDQTTFHGTYKDEAEMLRMVREGDLSIIEYLKDMSKNAYVGKLANDDSDSLRQLKNTILVAITLFSRAAIEGGLYPDTALTLTDRYFQSVESAKTFQEITDIAISMQTDFVSRVHKIKTVNKYSKAVRMMIEYIDLHKEDEIRLKDMAKELGYTEYYLSRKFKSETGVLLKDHIRDVRLQYAAHLLKNETISVREIAERLRFTSQSYFTMCFKEKYGKTPNQYREDPSQAKDS